MNRVLCEILNLGGYAKGEIAGFDQPVAERMVRSGQVRMLSTQEAEEQRALSTQKMERVRESRADEARHNAYLQRRLAERELGKDVSDYDDKMVGGRGEEVTKGKKKTRRRQRS